MMLSRVFSSAHTAARPEADMAQPSGERTPSSHSRLLFSGTESVAILPQKLSSSALAMPVWASVGADHAELVGVGAKLCSSARPRISAVRM